MIIITRHNYETFFLVYADNELSVMERKAVDDFVKANPDLQEELVMLQQSILKPDHIVFENKESLLKNEWTPAGLQEKLLSHMDNELSATETKETESLIGGDIEIKREWDILQQTKLLADRSIVFADKASLHRKETGRVVALPWRRFAVAAALIGFGIFGALIYFNGDKKVADTSTAKTATPKTIPAKGATRQVIVPQATQPNISSPTKNIVLIEKELAAAPTTNKQLPKQKTSPATQITALPKTPDNETASLANNKQDNNLPKPNLDNINNIAGNKTIATNVKPLKQPNNIVNPGNDDIAASTGTQETSGSFAANASYTDNSEKNNNRILFINEEKIKKTKLGGIFRKVKRVLERNTNIKTGGSNNIKVANLEFAIQ